MLFCLFISMCGSLQTTCFWCNLTNELCDQNASQKSKFTFFMLNEQQNKEKYCWNILSRATSLLLRCLIVFFSLGCMQTSSTLHSLVKVHLNNFGWDTMLSAKLDTYESEKSRWELRHHEKSHSVAADKIFSHKTWGSPEQFNKIQP